MKRTAASADGDKDRVDEARAFGWRLRALRCWRDLGRRRPRPRCGQKTRDKGVGVLVHGEQLAPQRIHHDVFVREVIADLLRQVRRDAKSWLLLAGL